MLGNSSLFPPPLFVHVLFLRQMFVQSVNQSVCEVYAVSCIIGHMLDSCLFVTVAAAVHSLTFLSVTDADPSDVEAAAAEMHSIVYAY